MLHKITLLIIILAASNLGMAHDIRTGLFKLYSEDGSYYLNIKLDREDLEEALGTDCSVDIKTLSVTDRNLMIEHYILDRFSIQFESQPVAYDLTQYDQDDQYVLIYGTLHHAITEAPSKITIQNRCLIDTVEKHDNIVHVHLNDRKRSFRLNLALQETTIEY